MSTCGWALISAALALTLSIFLLPATASKSCNTTTQCSLSVPHNKGWQRGNWQWPGLPILPRWLPDGESPSHINPISWPHHNSLLYDTRQLLIDATLHAQMKTTLVQLLLGRTAARWSFRGEPMRRSINHLPLHVKPPAPVSFSIDFLPSCSWTLSSMGPSISRCCCCSDQSHLNFYILLAETQNIKISWEVLEKVWLSLSFFTFF